MDDIRRAGYWINPGIGNHDFWYFGWAAQRQIAENLALGGELFHQTADTANGKDQTVFDLGVIYDLSEHYHLMFSAGQGVQNRATTDAFSYYASIQFTLWRMHDRPYAPWSISLEERA